MILIDGAKGEGGGQVLRTSLSLSACTGQAFRIKNIRSGRKKPGLMRQHLTCVRAAAAVCSGKAEGAALGSTDLTFTPGDPMGSEYTFDVGTAGATTLVFQTLLPILLMADEPSVVTLRGGTHTMAAPTLDFIEGAFLPSMKAIGVEVDVERHGLGFYPAGGGSWTVKIDPLQEPKSFELLSRGPLVRLNADAMRANLPADICQREVDTLKKRLGLADSDVTASTHEGPGPGNAISIFVRCKDHSEVFSAIGRFGVKAETVAANAANATERYLASNSAVSDHLADQLLLPLALFQGGRFSCSILTDHFLTNVETIQKFLDVAVETTADAKRVAVDVGRC